MSETTEQEKHEDVATELFGEPSELDIQDQQWYVKLLGELKEIADREDKVGLPFKYQRGKVIQRARHQWDKAHSPTGPNGWTKARHNMMTRLRRDLKVARSDLYAYLRFVELGMKRGKEGWGSFEEFANKRFSVRRGDSPQGETRVRGKDLTWKEVKEQVLRGKKRIKAESEEPTNQGEPSLRMTFPEGSSSPVSELQETPPTPEEASSQGIFVPLSSEVGRLVRDLASKAGKNPGRYLADLLEKLIPQVSKAV